MCSFPELMNSRNAYKVMDIAMAIVVMTAILILVWISRN
jgi:hypothetical protein